MTTQNDAKDETDTAVTLVTPEMVKRGADYLRESGYLEPNEQVTEGMLGMVRGLLEHALQIPESSGMTTAGPELGKSRKLSV